MEVHYNAPGNKLNARMKQGKAQLKFYTKIRKIRKKRQFIHRRRNLER